MDTSNQNEILSYIPITHTHMVKSLAPGDVISVNVRLYSYSANGPIYSNIYTLIADVEEVHIYTPEDECGVQFSMQAEHPLLLDERNEQSIESCTFEQDVCIGDPFELDIHMESAAVLLEDSTRSKKRMRHCVGFTHADNEIYRESLLDPEIAANVLLTGDGILTRNKFHPKI